MKNILVHKLSTLIMETKQNKNFTMTKLETLLKEFKCNRNSGITKFLEYSAIKGQENGTSNTYLILDDKRNNLRAFLH